MKQENRQGHHKANASAVVPFEARKGRGTISNRSSRFEKLTQTGFDDGWSVPDAVPEIDRIPTEIHNEPARKIITRNTSPDIPFDRSINPYRGCEHGCVYCFARPTHAFLGLSPGLDFETRLFAKKNAAELLENEITRPGYQVKPIAIGTNTDPYQPAEKKLRIMRGVLKVLSEANHPVTVVTKGSLILRDLDILSDMASRDLVKVAISVTTLDRKLARSMEPRASAPARRLTAMQMLSRAGVPTGVMVAPVIPSLTDHEMEGILTAAARSGATSAAYIMLRLPLEIKDLFREWLDERYPGRASRILSHVETMRGGRLNDPRFKHRMKGEGAYATLINQRFKLVTQRLGLNREEVDLDCEAFRPQRENPQLDLFESA